MRSLLLIILLGFALPVLSQEVGDTLGGGTVFYVQEPTDTTDGLAFIVSKDIFIDSASTDWGCYGVPIQGDMEFGANGQGWNAQSNGVLVMNSCYEESAVSRVQAYDSQGKEATWYLPTVVEFEIMYQNLYENGLGGFNGNYWASYESVNDRMHVYGNDTVWRMLEDSTGNLIPSDDTIYGTHAYYFDFDEPISIYRPKVKIKTDKNDYKPYRGVRYHVIPALLVTGLDDLASVDVNVYPNPTNGTITIEGVMPSDYIVYTIQGEVVSTGGINGGKKVLDLTDLSGGTYFIRLIGSNIITKTITVN
jgi:hypothetical protein